MTHTGLGEQPSEQSGGDDEEPLQSSRAMLNGEMRKEHRVESNVSVIAVAVLHASNPRVGLAVHIVKPTGAASVTSFVLYVASVERS